MKSYKILALLLTICLAAFAVPGEKLVAEWDFGVKQDSSVDGKFPGGVFRGNTKVVDGWLTMAPGTEDKAEGFSINPKKIYPELTPEGGFRMEVVVKLYTTQTQSVNLMMFDNKYLLGTGKNSPKGTNHGFAFALNRDKNGNFAPQTWMGFADDSVSIQGKRVPLTAGEPHTITMEYNGANRVKFFIDGELNRVSTFKGGPLSKAIRSAIIGDRIGSMHNRFDGQIKSVKLYAFPPQTLVIGKHGRFAFIRGEKNISLSFKVTNAGATDIKNAKVDILLNSKQYTAEAGDLKAGESRIVEITNLGMDNSTPGAYSFEAKLTGVSPTGAVEDIMKDMLSIGPAMPPDSMPVLMWGGGNINVMKASGFTHDLGGLAESVRRSTNLEATAASINETLDRYVAAGFRRASYFTLAHAKDLIEKFPRYTKDGAPVVKNIEASNPEYQAIITDVADKTSKIIANHPGCDAMLINSEVRDSTSPSFGKYEPEAFKKFAGYPIPEQVTARSGINYSRISNFPFSRIVKDDDPIFTYYKWFWKVGDGWNTVHSKVSEAYHKNIKRPYWSFFDPAVRVPPVWGSGGTVDYISHWTYAYPDPIRSAAVTDEMRAMADGQPGQDVMSMTQIICYRSATAPVGSVPENEPAWVKDSPKGPYISIPPDSLRASIWSMISRRVQGIMFHGSQSLWGKPGNSGYVMTNPDTKVMLSKVLNEVVKPLGPTLKRIPERKPEVAILQSFASSVFAGRGTWGWSGWLFETHLMLQWANLSPAVIYEEKIARDGLDGIKVLCLFHCDVLAESAYKKILEFQKKGGIIVADEFLTPAIMPDILVPSIVRSSKADVGKKQIQDAAASLRAQLDKWYKPYSDADNMDLITRVRTFKDADYLFVLSDKRTFGDYLGPWGLTMEKGLPNSGNVILKRNAKVVYDVLAHQEVPFETKDGAITIPQKFETNDGRLLLVMDKKIGKVKCQVPSTCKVGEQVQLNIKVMDDSFFAKPIQALIPIDISITSPDGITLDCSGAACAEDGVYNYNFTPYSITGKWTVTVTELASGKKTRENFVVK